MTNIMDWENEKGETKHEKYQERGSTLPISEGIVDHPWALP